MVNMPDEERPENNDIIAMKHGAGSPTASAGCSPATCAVAQTTAGKTARCGTLP
eukprot:NODE_30293_length_196_cov_0.809524_g29123_i0.p1 GENE.NODE_30293_length_196_cov_0.809524_g29123_i0~~NODE_30293_length_196_cov_0.809524_g29123_i0.p1  ORF type:complete len:54 (+),score=3.55 NODE_30293_length_196_cov_0.809524_g29123_i0:7-168(+)